MLLMKSNMQLQWHDSLLDVERKKFDILIFSPFAFLVFFELVPRPSSL